ncbi:MAG: cutinase family protein [Candidatus Saccharimonadales bacterium]
MAVNNNLYTNAIGAVFSGGQSFAYGDSVKQGVGELKSYLAQRYNKCKSTGTQYILGGYSQGAQVVGQALPDIAREIRDNIVFAGFFGDPKLHYPEGFGPFPPAKQMDTGSTKHLDEPSMRRHDKLTC